jgi:diketogulonate reductase-like aldo/keto reductase
MSASLFTTNMRHERYKIQQRARQSQSKEPPRTLLSRREFTGLCAALGSFVSSSNAFAFDATTVGRRTVKFRDGTIVPALGQGSWHLAQGRHPAAEEEDALRTGISLGMTLIDTAEVYSSGHSEELIGRAIAGRRDDVFLVSKVLPMHATGDGMIRACEASLARLGTDHLDLYLLHWRNGIADLSGVVASFESLRSAGKIYAWGVSNFTVRDMEDLFQVPQGDRCATNQVHYNLGDRNIEGDLLPWCEQHGMPVMAYSPLGGPGADLLRDAALQRIGSAHDCSAAAVALAWTIRSGHVIAIPESGSVAHVKENAVALSLTLIPQELQTLDTAYPPPSR